MNVEDFQKLLTDIEQFKTNRNKDNKERRENSLYTENKLIDLGTLIKRFETLKCIFASNIHKTDFTKEVKVYSQKIKIELESLQTLLHSRLNKQVKMADKFDLKVVSGLLPIMNGNEDITKQLIDGIIFYAGTLGNDQHKLLIQYVLKTRLSNNAKIRLNSDYNTIEELIKDITTNFITKKSVLTLSTQLHQIKQNNASISEYGQQIEKLLGELTISQAGDDEKLIKTLKPINEKIAINTFCNGIKNPELRTIVKSRNADSLKTAINIAEEEDFNKPTSTNLFNYRFNKHKRFHGHANTRENYNTYRKADSRYIPRKQNNENRHHHNKRTQGSHTSRLHNAYNHASAAAVNNFHTTNTNSNVNKSNTRQFFRN